MPLRLVENKPLPAPRHNQHAATQPRIYPCHPQPPIPPDKIHPPLQRNINAEMQKPQTRREKGQHALTTLTAHSSRRHSPARCRSVSSSPSPCPRPDTISMQPRIHASTHAIRSPIPPEIHPPLQRLSIEAHGKPAETYSVFSFRSFAIESPSSNFKLPLKLKSTPLTRSFVQLTPCQSHKSVLSAPHPCSASHAL